MVKGQGSFNPLAVDHAIVSRGRPEMMATVGGRRYVLGRGANCRVCNSQWRFEIEDLILDNLGWETIVRLLPEDAITGDDPITARHVASHVKSQHLPTLVAKSVIARSVRVMALGKSMEDFEGSMVDRVLVGQAMMDTYYRQLVLGQIRPTGADVLGAMKMFAEIERESQGSIDTDVYNQIIGVMLKVFQESVMKETYDEVIYRIQHNPIVKAIVAEMERAEAPDTFDAIEARAT